MMPKHRGEGKVPPAAEGDGVRVHPLPGKSPSQAAPAMLCGGLLHRVVCPASPATSPGKSDEAENILFV